jgi:hypothetical protein
MTSAALVLEGVMALVVGTIAEEFRRERAYRRRNRALLAATGAIPAGAAQMPKSAGTSPIDQRSEPWGFRPGARERRA